MQHSILQSPCGKRSTPVAAVEYLLRPTDAKNEAREQAPRIIRGDAISFIHVSELIAKEPKYLSTALSDQTPPDEPIIRYVSDIFLAHYLAGIPPDHSAAFIVLHPKKNSWDLHILLALAIKMSAKKISPVRPRADFLRFARVACLINRMTGWKDPLDPKNLRPAHFVETWRPKDARIKDLDEAIASAFRAQTIESRSDLVSLVKRCGFTPTVSDTNISLRSGCETWRLKGYAATKHAESAAKLSAYCERVSRPFREAAENPIQVGSDIREAYFKTLAANKVYHGIDMKSATDGHLVPDSKFYQDKYEHGKPKNDEPVDAEKLVGAEHPRNAAGHEAICVRFPDSGEPVSRNLPRYSLDQAGTEQQLPTVNGLGIEPQGVGKTDRLRRIQVQRAYDGVAEVRKDLEATRQRFEEWFRLIFYLLRIPQWYRKHRAMERRRARDFLRRYPCMRIQTPPGYLVRLLLQPLPEENTPTIVPVPLKKEIHHEHDIT